MKRYRVIYTVDVEAKSVTAARKEAARLWEEEVDSVDTQVYELKEPNCNQMIQGGTMEIPQ